MISAPHISVVICTRDRPDDARRCLKSLAGVAYPHWDIALIDQSTDLRTRDVARGFARSLPHLAYHHTNEVGLSRARNKGVAATGGEIVAFLDDDCTVPPDWLERMAAAFARHPDAAIIYGMVRAAPHDPTESYVLVYPVAEERALRGRAARARARGIGAAMYLRRTAIGRVGPFDAHLGAGADLFRSMEDADYAYRCLAAGLEIVESPDIHIEHHGLRSYGNGDAARETREQAHAEAAMNMKLLRCGDLSALPLTLMRGLRQLHFISWRHLIRRDGPTGLGRIAMYLRGLYDSFLLPVDRRRRLYGSARDHAP